MGYPMAANIIKNVSKSGHKIEELHVYDAFPGQADRFVEDMGRQKLGGSMKIKASPNVAEVATNSNTIILMLPNTSHVESVLTAGSGQGDNIKNGIFAHASRGSMIIDCSTIDPTSSRKFNETARHEYGLRMLDCPVSGGVTGADAGTLTFMIGSEEKDFEEAKVCTIQYLS